uniref:Uncharacterized protein n=1 Tax=Grateloupia filicina TaxID=31455 RepID=A0A2S1FXH5_9FLOR|nr:hypothetical protein Grafi_p167 [Grateloupia filicina]AWD77475.1 hypothetical protein Grafi_p167 [Grateloupia filicina]
MISLIIDIIPRQKLTEFFFKWFIDLLNCKLNIKRRF